MIMVTAGDGGASLTARKRARCSRSGARGAVVEAAGGGDAAALLVRCRRHRARTPVHGTQGGGPRSCSRVAGRARRAALLGREPRASPRPHPPSACPDRREREFPERRGPGCLSSPRPR